MLVTVFLAAQAWAQGPSEATALRDPFDQWHAALNRAADSLLATPVRRESTPSPEHPASVERTEKSVAPESAARKASVERAWQRVEQLRPLIDPILRVQGIPAELAATVVIESGGQQMALSPKGARGIWQLMPDTARRYGLTVDASRDERVDVQKSTWAAARYMRDLYRRFGSWPLALAAYNAGEDAVNAASAKARSTEFNLISSWLPMETRNYVPAVLAAIAQLSKIPPGRFARTSAARVLYAAATLN